MNKATLRGAEVCCGTKSITKVAEKKGIKMITVDNDEQHNPDIIADMRILNLGGSEMFLFWASPPCQCFSVASISTHWKGGHRAYIPKTAECMKAYWLLDNIINNISLIKPTYWFIENPRGVMRKVIEPIFEKYGMMPYRRTVTYCQYGDRRMKPTDIWTNCKEWIPRPMCKNGDDCHESAPRGAKTGTQGLKGSVDRSIVPEELCEEIVKVITEVTE